VSVESLPPATRGERDASWPSQLVDIFIALAQFPARQTNFDSISRRRSSRQCGSELRGEFCHVVGEERRLVAGAGDGNVAEAGVEQVRVDAGIGRERGRGPR